MYPPVPLIARKVNEDVQLASEDYVIPKGATVVIGTYKIHRRPDIYPNPDKFDPDNFLPERTQNRNYYGFIPFSAGPRKFLVLFLFRKSFYFNYFLIIINKFIFLYIYRKLCWSKICRFKAENSAINHFAQL